MKKAKSLIRLGQDSFKIDYRTDEEVGGLIIGYQGDEDTDYNITDIIQLKNCTPKDKQFYYQLPGTFICFLHTIKYLLMGRQVIGVWHSHTNGFTHPTLEDERAIYEKVKRCERLLLGIVCNNQMRIYRYSFIEFNKKKNGFQTTKKLHEVRSVKSQRKIARVQ